MWGFLRERSPGASGTSVHAVPKMIAPRTYPQAFVLGAIIFGTITQMSTHALNKRTTILYLPIDGQSRRRWCRAG